MGKIILTDEQSFEQDERYNDRFINTSLSFWNSLITLNAIVIGAISILLTIDTNYSNLLLIIVFSSSFISVILITWNMFFYKNTFQSIIDLDDKYQNKSDDEIDKLHKEHLTKTISGKKNTRIREFISLCLTTVAIVLLFIGVVASQIKCH